MKKLCKQSLAVLTMLALLLTFAPGTLRAANHAEADASYFTVDRSEDNNSSLVTVKKNEVVKASFDICDAAGNATTAPLEKVYIWATDANGVISSALNVKDAKKGDIANTWYFDKVTDGQKVEISFSRDGTYVICAGSDRTSGGASKVGNLSLLASGDLNPQPDKDGKKAETETKPNGEYIDPDAKADGMVGEDITVTMRLRDSSGRTMAPGRGSRAFAMVVSSTNPKAKVTAEVERDSDLSRKGEVDITVTSDRSTTAVIRAVITAGSGRMYNVEQTVVIAPNPNKPEEDPDKPDKPDKPDNPVTPDKPDTPDNPVTPDKPEDGRIIMTIGSADAVVKGKITGIGVAPFVRDNRTYVPIRALAEGFGASVKWDETTRTVTVTGDNTVVVMTADKTAYTVNGKAGTMDVAPLIEDSRTFVPVRFVADALGYGVTPSYNAAGLTESVSFTK